MNGFDLSNVADVRVGSILAKQVYIGSKKIWDSKTAPAYTAPTAKTGLVYDGTAQELVNAGSTDHGTIYYSLDNTNWSAAVPTSTNANSSITVYWKLVGDSRHTDISPTTITCSIAKAAATYTAPTAKSLTYNGSSQELLNAGVTAHGTIQYSTDNTNWGTSVPSGQNATSYTTYWRLVGDSNHNNVAGNSISVTISKVTPTITIPTAKVLTYNGSAQELVNVGSTNFGTLQYKVGSDSWSTSVPTRTRGGSYTLYYRVVGDSNINDISSDSIQCSIGEKSVTANITLSQDTYTYNGSAFEPSVVVKDGTTTIDPSEYTVTYSNNTNAGTATVTISDNVGGDYNVIGSKTFTINKVTPSVSAPTAKSLTYNGNAQVLANAGSTNWGTLQYSLDGTNWSTSIPSGMNATSYTLYYRVVGNANINDVSAQSITCSIGKASPSYNAPTANSGLVYNGNAQNLLVAGSTSHGTIQYSSDNVNWSTSVPTGTNAQSYDTYWRLVGDSNHSDVSSTKISNSIGKASISPSVSMSGWTYGATASNPSVSGNSGNGGVTYTYKVSGAADSTYTTSKPSNAGEYVVKAVIAETSNYYGATITNSFIIARADRTISFTSAPLSVIKGNTISVAASASAGDGTITYSSSDTSKATVSGNVITGVSKGSVTITASIPQTTNYNSASATYTLSIVEWENGNIWQNNLIWPAA